MSRNKIILISVLALILVALFLTVINYNKKKHTTTNEVPSQVESTTILSNRFSTVEYDSNFYVVTDIATSNQYIMYKSRHGVALCNLTEVAPIINTNPTITINMPSGSLL